MFRDICYSYVLLMSLKYLTTDVILLIHQFKLGENVFLVSKSQLFLKLTDVLFIFSQFQSIMAKREILQCCFKEMNCVCFSQTSKPIENKKRNSYFVDEIRVALLEEYDFLNSKYSLFRVSIFESLVSSNDILGMSQFIKDYKSSRFITFVFFL